MASRYKTAGRQRLLGFLEENPDRHFTAEEIADALTESGKSSVYRQLSGLCRDGAVRKYRSDTQSAYVYQFVGFGDCQHHFHLKCVRCGKVIHLNCGLSDELIAHVGEEHGFGIDTGRSILYGYCADCEEERGSDQRETF